MDGRLPDAAPGRGENRRGKDLDAYPRLAARRKHPAGSSPAASAACSRSAARWLSTRKCYWSMSLPLVLSRASSTWCSKFSPSFNKGRQNHSDRRTERQERTGVRRRRLRSGVGKARARGYGQGFACGPGCRSTLSRRLGLHSDSGSCLVRLIALIYYFAVPRSARSRTASISAPANTTIAESHIQVMKPIMAPSEP